jgi:DNA-binding NtrC family response regulator
MGKILIVDDEQDILSILTTLLTTSGHEVVPALGGEVALKVMNEHEDFDLMISDIRMSPVDGMQLLRAMHDQSPTTAVIMLTAYGQIDTAMEARDLGAFDYVKKPFKGADLLETVNKAIEYHKLNTQQADGLDV